MSKELIIFSGRATRYLTEKIAKSRGHELGEVDVLEFNDGEFQPSFEENVRGKEVFVVCTTTSTTSIMELLLTVSALRRGSAKRICAVIPYYGYSRQDRRTGMKRGKKVIFINTIGSMHEINVSLISILPHPSYVVTYCLEPIAAADTWNEQPENGEGFILVLLETTRLYPNTTPIQYVDMALNEFRNCVIFFAQFGL